MFRYAVSGPNTIVVICEWVARFFWILQEDSISRLDRHIIVEVVDGCQEETVPLFISSFPHIKVREPNLDAAVLVRVLGASSD
jgi:hypothetical protein